MSDELRALRLIDGHGRPTRKKSIPPANLAPSNPVSCAKCGVVFWMTAHLETERRADHQTFYCPNGHTLVWNARTATDALRDELAAAREELARIKKRLPSWAARWLAK